MSDLIYPLISLPEMIALSIQLWPVLEFFRRSTCKEFLDKLTFDSQYIIFSIFSIFSLITKGRLYRTHTNISATCTISTRNSCSASHRYGYSRLRKMNTAINRRKNSNSNTCKLSTISNCDNPDLTKRRGPRILIRVS